MQSLPSVHDEFTAEEARTVDAVIHGFLAHVQRHGMTRAVAGLYFASSSGYASCELQDQVNAQGYMFCRLFPETADRGASCKLKCNWPSRACRVSDARLSAIRNCDRPAVGGPA